MADNEEENVATRAVAFHHDQEIEEKPRPKGRFELKHTLTQDDKELAAAGYDHLEEKKKTGAGETNVDITEHSVPLASLGETLKTSIDTKDPGNSHGLTAAEAAARLARDGPNLLTPPKKRSPLRQYIDRLLTMFNVLLIVAGILEYILLGIDFKNNFANTYLGGILIAVAFLNAFIDCTSILLHFVQKSEAILASFLAMIPPSCRVVRDGAIISIPAKDLVFGDVVLVRVGDKTPADLVLFAATDLKVDNSSLTGESEPQERFPVSNGSQSRPVEAQNLAFNSTLVVNGEAWGIVVRTGDHTFIGQIASLTGGESGNESPLAVEIGQFVIKVSCIAVVFAIVFFVVGITTAYKGKASQTVTFAVSILVAFVPEGLPSVVTLLLSIAAKRMASQNLTLLATDKTGTLTRNQMTVTNLWSGGRMYSAFQSNNDEETTAPFSLEASGMAEMVDIAALNSRVKFDKTDVPFDQRQILGDATETGLARFAGRQLSSGYDQHQKSFPKVFEVPFNSTNKWALVILNKPHADGVLTSYIKGAPERVLAKCSTYLKDGVVEPMTDDFRQAYDDAYDYMASRGHRVIACAQALLPGAQYPAEHEFSRTDNNYPTSDYCFVGLVSLEDPPKHGVREAIGTLRDHPKTAEAIARKINLIIGDTRETLAARTGRQVDEIYEDEVNAVVIHGDDIDELQGWQWDQIFSKEEIVFARTSPKHKLEIVKRAQALGHIVGVTGDGVNDSPALKKADLGIAMNISGSDVSKEAANMILLGVSCAKSIRGVAEGRQIFVNLKRSIQYTLSHSTPEVIPQLLYVVVPIPLPLSAILILVIDLGFELFVATQEVLAPSKLSVLIGKLKKPFTRTYWEDAMESNDGETLVDSKLLSYAYLEAGLIEMLGALVGYFVVFYKSGFTPGDLRRAQKIGLLNSTVAITNNPYFTSSSPDFINSRGETIPAWKQVDAFGQAQSISKWTLVFAVKAKFTFPFGKAVVGNKLNFAGIVAGAVLGMFIIYTPPLHVVFGGSVHLSPLYWLIPVGFGCLLLAWASIRVLILRKSIEDSRVKDIKGLMMFPTMRTMSMRSKGAQ
ncbi:aminophospholipid-transporting P-type ATPase [Mycena olivaceomarginata]|nr:aminophospholipid-transporting P-type ATPase [Mycena olivaceomarginata]